LLFVVFESKLQT